MSDTMVETVPASPSGHDIRAVRLPLAFDPVRLRADVDCFATVEWTDHFVRQNYAGDWSVVPLRAPVGAVHPILRITAHAAIGAWENTLELAASPYLAEVLGYFNCPIDGARLMRLGPGSEIHEHSDPDLDTADGSVRLHIPVRTNADVVFEIDHQRIALGEGEVWYLHLSRPHCVVNCGLTARIHLVIDARRNGWLDRLIAAGTPV